MKRFLKKLYNYGNDCILGLGKELILGLIILFVGLIGFGNCATVSSLLPLETVSDFTVGTNWTLVLSLPSDFDGTYCLKFDNGRDYVGNMPNLLIGNSSNSSNPSINYQNYFYYFWNWFGNYVCSYTAGGWTYIYAKANGETNITLDYESFILNDLLDSDLPIYSSEQCQQEYSLMPINSCNSEYCELNGLCSVIGGSGSSTLYINDVRHESAPFIYVNIPEEFKWDYLTGEQEFTINVEGLNGDQDYINGIIDVNSYRPSSEDFTQTFVSGLTLIFPYIIITAVILFIRRFIRKIFK